MFKRRKGVMNQWNWRARASRVSDKETSKRRGFQGRQALEPWRRWKEGKAVHSVVRLWL